MLADPWTEPVRCSRPFQGVTTNSRTPPPAPAVTHFLRPWHKLCAGGPTEMLWGIKPLRPPLSSPLPLLNLACSTLRAESIHV